MANIDRVFRAPRIRAALVTIVVLLPATGMAMKLSEWTGWSATSDPLVQWRQQIEDWGRNGAPGCRYEFRINGEGAANFRYDLTFHPEGEGAEPSGHRVGWAYGVTRDKDHADRIAACRRITGALITRVVRRGAGSSSITRRATPGEAPRTGGTQPVTRDRDRDRGLKAPRDVINFPGPYRGPDLTSVRMDSRSLTAVHAASHRLNQRLLNWRPLRLWANHQAADLRQADWQSLSTMVSRVDKQVARELASDASRLAGGYPYGSTLQRFWQGMADGYRRRATLE